MNVKPVNDQHIEFHYGSVHAVCHSIEAARAMAASHGFTLEEIRKAYTPQEPGEVNEITPQVHRNAPGDLAVIDVSTRPGKAVKAAKK